MSFVQRMLGASAAPEARAITHSDLFGYNLENSHPHHGAHVSAEMAMQSSAVFACVRIISDSVSTLPLDFFREVKEARVPFRPIPVWAEFQGPTRRIDTISAMVVSMLLHGNAFAAIYRDRDDRIIDVMVLDPTTVSVELVDGEIKYRVLGGALLTAMDILHIPAMMMPGDLVGMSPIACARESISLSLAATTYGGAFFANGAVPGVAVEVPGELSDQGIRQLKKSWNDVHKGAANSHKLAVMTEGAKFTKVSVNPDDAQFLQTRQFQVSDITRIFGVPPHLVADASNSTSWGSGLAQQNTTFVQHTLRPLAERLETGFNWLMRSEGLPKNTFSKLVLDGLLRGDTMQRLESYEVGLRNGFYTIDEVRAWEDMPALTEEQKPKPAAPPAPPTTDTEESEEESEEDNDD